MADWQNRIVGTDVKPASSFLANEANWRIHPAPQQSALLGSLEEVGWVQDVIINLRSDPSWGADRGVETLIDGHLRVTLALREGDDTLIPVTMVDLLPHEEKLILSTFDPIGFLAVADREKLDALLRDVTPESAALQQMLSELAAREGLIPPDDPSAEWQGMPEFVHEDQTSAYRAIVHFATEEDMQEFEGLIGQKIPENTKAIWFPKARRDVVRGERYASD